MSLGSQLPVTVTIIAYNEENRLPRALASVQWADEIIVVDSGSTDQTRAVVEKWGARWVDHPWSGYGQQKNFAQSLAKNIWVLNLDADEVVSPELYQEVVELFKTGNIHKGPKCYAFPRRTHFLGRWIRYGGWYPNYVARFSDRRETRWTEPAVHEKLVHSSGHCGRLQFPVDHFTFDGIADQVETNLRYARQGADHLRAKGVRGSVFKLMFKPLGKFMETYFWKLGFLDGVPGFMIAVNAAHSMFLKFSFLMESELYLKGKGQEKV